ncbi:Putative glycoside hydrolase family 16, concanavalin A-like lectin/glucanase domain superfamily [Septoria linicola]|uniref:Glycoside hydrolase family 16, concanavalin A-like lectin/glucanase domain superfamily n=1 Tax=Septoria linicola TaxID=215465 RepID=A0A9Q9EH66_9PEZI|nr:putative glycoside hydrolase family 16, concanavalin A-like lectin/glucanase domain superfamily [Septoria linicola]USW49577.1 Putative glycoside hydrolase family 16, concanavalin A-like lectin/glucanase domain superfamily [Septoria linicola]
MKSTFTSAAALLAGLALVSAQSSAPKCSPGSPCPADAPCCSQYGQCGVGAYCLGGCDPKSSFSLKSCMAAPTCKSSDYKLDSLDDVMPNTKYLGDASKANWVSSGTAVAYNGDSLLLTMAPSTVGTLLSSTHYVWYGKISATMTSSRGQGVVTAFILMSDVKDEIDFEFVGDNVESAQSNYYYQGITNYENMNPLKTTDTQANVHTYTIDWTPDHVIWSIDGKEMRTLNREDTWNSTTGSYNFPQTPSRIQLSLWPAGLSSNGEGTIEWAGGLVDWDGPYMQNGYYYSMVSDITVECYDPPSGFSGNAGGSAYYYTGGSFDNNTVAIGTNNTVLGSLMASGENPDFGKVVAGASSTSSAAQMTNTPESVPGVSGGGNVASSGQAPVDTESDNSGNSGSSGSGSGSGSGSSGSTGGSNGFSQGGGSSGASTGEAPRMIATSSAVALLGFFVAALML